MSGGNSKLRFLEKFRLNAESALGAEAVEKLVTLATHVEEQPSMKQMMSLLGR